jgi:hypothetical protein
MDVLQRCSEPNAKGSPFHLKVHRTPQRQPEFAKLYLASAHRFPDNAGLDQPGVSMIR